MENITYGLISVADWEDYKALRLEALQNDPQAFLTTYQEELESPDEKWQSRLQKAEDANGALLIFAKDIDKYIGLAGAYWKDGDDTINIVSVYVSKNYRGQGIGKKLMEELFNQIATKTSFKKAKLEVNSEQGTASKLYEKLGFKKVSSEKTILGDGNEYEVIAMEKELN